MNDQYRHLRHAVRIQIHSIDEKILGLRELRSSLISFGEQMDKVINKIDIDDG